jgi:hypothetical protein
MAATWRSGLLLCGLLILAGCSRTEEYRAVVRDQKKAIDELTDILARIDDEKGMAGAQEALDERIDRFERIASKARALPKPSPDVVEQLESDAAALKRASEKLVRQVNRVRELPGAEKFFKQFKGRTSLFSTSP